MNLKDKLKKIRLNADQKKISLLPPCEDEKRFSTNPDFGLSRSELDERIEQGKVNTPVDSPLKTTKEIILSNIFTYFNIIFIVIALALVFCKSFNHLMFLPIIAVNTTIGIIQEIRSRNVLQKLNLLNSPKSRVIREGTRIDISTDSLVKDDIVVLSSGDQIAADAIVVSGEITVNESLVTGESDEISKHSGDSLLSGSFVVGGECLAQLTNVGANSFVSKLTVEAKQLKKSEKTGMMRSLTMLIKFIGIIIIPIAFLLIFRQIRHLNISLSEAIVSTAAALLGMIPEGLYLLVTIALAISVIRLSKSKTLVHELKSIETLARVDVLCVDKTGTITENKMTVSDVIPIAEYSNENKSDIVSLIAKCISVHTSDNSTLQALKEYFNFSEHSNPLSVIPFSSETKFSSVSFAKGNSLLIGAPEFILRHQYSEYKSVIDNFTSEGYRVLLFARYPEELTTPVLTTDVEPIALITLSNLIRSSAKNTFEYFEKQGVKIKVISGDNPVTASVAAQKVCITGAENYIDATQLDSDEKISEAVLKNTVFGRVTPEQKRKFIKALKRAGHVVAMTGDGVNDVLALKESDCSIAMASGSDVASHVSQLVLLDSDFSAMPSIVAEGRRVINNIERSASLFLVKNIFSFLLACVSIIAMFAYPVTPAQLTLVNVVTIGIPSFILALEPNTDIVHGKFLRNVIGKAAPAALTDFIVVFLAMLFSKYFNIPQDEISTVSAILIGIVGFIMLFRICKPFDIKRILLYVFMAIGFVIGLTVMPSLFSMSNLSKGSFLVLLVLAFCAYPCMYALTFIFDSFVRLYNKFVSMTFKKRT